MLASEVAELSRQEQISFVQGLILAKGASNTTAGAAGLLVGDSPANANAPPMVRGSSSEALGPGSSDQAANSHRKDDASWEDLDESHLGGIATEAGPAQVSVISFWLF